MKRLTMAIFAVLALAGCATGGGNLISLIDITVPSLDNVHSVAEKEDVLYVAVFKYRLACEVANAVAAKGDLANILAGASVARTQLSLTFDAVEAQKSGIAPAAMGIDVGSALQRATAALLTYYPILYATQAQLAQLRTFQSTHAVTHGLSAAEIKFVTDTLATEPSALKFGTVGGGA